MIELTPEELAGYDGTAGSKAYVAYAGYVYDVTASFLWQGGRHQALHRAGRDLTGEIEAAPHGPELLLRVPRIGRLVGP